MPSETSPADVMGFTLPMLSIPEKKTKCVDLCDPLLQDINRKLSKRDVQVLKRDVLEREVSTASKRRSQLAKPAKEGLLTARRGLLQSYFRDLNQIETLFSSPKDQINNVTFIWYDAFEKNILFKKKEKASQQSILLEKAAVLFNLGAVYSQIGQREDRSTEEGQWEAVQAFRRAAGVFAHRKDDAAAEASMGESTTVDLSKECAAMLEKLMLAQAQECCLKIVIDKGRVPEDHAKIFRQVALYYEGALAALNVAPLKGHVDKGWISHVKLKAALFNAGARYRHGLELDEINEIGEKIAWLRSGISTLEEANKSSKGGPAELFNAIDRLEANMNTSLNEAKNVRMCFMEGPSPNSLPLLPSRSLVKLPITMDEVLGVSKEEKMLASLSCVSRYAEVVDDIIRNHEEKLQQCSEDISTRLEDMDLGSILALEGHTLPAYLKKDVEEVQMRGGPAGFKSELEHLRRMNQERRIETQELLQTRPQPSTLIKSSQDQLIKIINDLKQAAKTDVHIEYLVNYHSPLMSILDSQTIESAFPSILLGEKEVSRVKAIKESLRELNTLGEQGKRLQDDLMRMKRKDDILPKLVASTGSQEDLFKEEMSKYKPTSEKIDQNIEEREKLLRKIQDENDRLSSFSKLEDYKASRRHFFEKIQDSIAKYQEIKEKIDQVKNFYGTLQDTITNVKQPYGEFMMTRNMPHHEMIGSESDIYGPATSDFVAGRGLEGVIREILELGKGKWDRGTVVRALDAADNNPDRAVNSLLSGIHEQAGVPPAARVPPSAQAANPPTQPAQPAQPATGQLPSAMPQAVTFMSEEREAMQKLEAMGFGQESVREAYLACSRNEILAAHFLLDRIHDSED